MISSLKSRRTIYINLQKLLRSFSNGKKAKIYRCIKNVTIKIYLFDPTSAVQMTQLGSQPLFPQLDRKISHDKSILDTTHILSRYIDTL